MELETHNHASQVVGELVYQLLLKGPAIIHFGIQQIHFIYLPPLQLSILQSQKAMLPNKPTFTLPAHLLLFILLLYSFAFSCQQACNHQDQSSLLAFSANISISPSSVPLNWSSPISCCQWEGVKCDINGRVTHLQLPSRGLKGVLVTSSISSLVMLTHLNLSNNNLHGSLGEDISMFTNLRIIDLSSNNIVGSIPQEIGKLLYLEKLHLYGNNVSGPIPTSLMNCTHLVEIILRDNFLRGDISKLDFSKLAQLQKLDLRSNSLNGTLPESIYSCKSLIAIRVAGNIISGQISTKITKLKSLSFLSLAQNSFTNITLTLRVLAKCKNLTFLSLSFNFYGESLPVQTNFIGLGDFPKLQFFMLEHCNFEAGPIPYWLSALKSLHSLILGGNRLTGRVPNFLGTLPNLFTLNLENNSLYGELPLELWQLPALISEKAQADLKLSHFELPVFFFFDNPVNFIRLKADYYQGLYLSHNAFNGNIPEEIGSLQNIQELFLNDNQFSGHIPISMSNLRKLETLDLSTNNLTREIPILLANLNFLSHFNVSYNDLEGPIPTGGQFHTFDQSSFDGNPGLCGEPLNHPCSNPATSKTRDINGRHDNKQPFLNGLYVGFASGFSSILIVVMSYVWFNYCKRHRTSSRRG